ncbi:MAG TPA: DUF6511 domain-containing protein [Steroidobacteraceae bacterium]|nr:DUF6511 domain-containing protein [Steroidobacteraceae bacterium]
MTHPLASDSHLICAVCRGQAWEQGYKPSRFRPGLWACHDTTCSLLLKKVWMMNKETLDGYEHKAALAAGDDAGAWLDGIGKSDLAALSKEEWEEFLGLIVIGFQSHMRRIIENGEAPF